MTRMRASKIEVDMGVRNAFMGKVIAVERVGCQVEDSDDQALLDFCARSSY